MGKIKYEDVKANIEEKGWQLLSTSYHNLKSELELKCPEQHLCYTTYEKFRNNNFICPICEQNKYYKMEESFQKKKGFRTLAFDQASITSGWSLFDEQELISYGKHTSDGNKSTERIANTKYWFVSMIKKAKPDKVILEDIQLQQFGSGNENVLTFKKLAHLQGVLKNYLFENGIPYEIVHQATWRAYSKIKGKSRADQKKSAQLKVKELYDISVDNDTADAILIGKWGAAQHKKSEIIEF